MTRKEFQTFGFKFFAEADQLSEKKNADYATGGIDSADAFANFRLLAYMADGRTLSISKDKQSAFGAFIRLLDKVSRLFNYLAFDYDFQVTDEKFRDICLDGANYFKIICAIEEENLAKKKEFPF